MSGTFSKKYPVCCSPFTRTPSSRSRVTHRHTVERDTPISLAMRAPLTTIVAFSASKVSSAAMRRSVVPAGVDGEGRLRITKISSVIPIAPNRELQLFEFPLEGSSGSVVFDRVDKQAHIHRRRGMGQRSGRKKISPSFGIGPSVLNRNAAGNLDHAVPPQSPRQLHATPCSLRRHVVKQHRLRSRFQRLVQLLLVAYLDLNRQGSARTAVAWPNRRLVRGGLPRAHSR